MPKFGFRASVPFQIVVLGLFILGFSSASQAASARLDAVRTIIEAVNARDADLYASVMSEDVVVRLFGETPVLSSRDALRANRAQHFASFPKNSSEIQHLVKIGDRVIMHDRVWLHGKDKAAADIVEVFQFSGDQITEIHVIQAPGLLNDADH